MQCQFNLLYREEEREMMPYCDQAGIAVTTFSPLARGFLTGAERTARTAHDIYLNFYGDAIDRRDRAPRARDRAASRRLAGTHCDRLGGRQPACDCRRSSAPMRLNRSTSPSRPRRSSSTRTSASTWKRRTVRAMRSTTTTRCAVRAPTEDHMIYVGEGFEGSGGNAAHINLLLGPKDGPIAAAWATAAASPGPGHIPFQAVLKPNVPVKPATLFIAKSVLKDARHEI